MTPTHSRASVHDIMALLPQTQCGRCGFDGCRPYAQALLRGHTELNRCPPGGDTTRLALATLLGREPRPWEPPLSPELRLRVAIDQGACIGCGRCLPACPVDAIAGAVGYAHVVLKAECTGCQLCLAPCPADCFVIETEPNSPQGPWPDRSQDEARRARLRFHRKRRRLKGLTRPESARASAARKRQEIKEALARVRRERGWQAGVGNRRIAPSE